MEGTEFNNNSPIYRQIARSACGRILSGEWRDGEKIPSVRELSIEMAVNTRTVLKAMEFLQDKGIIYPKRGMGFYAADDARKQVYSLRREEFFAEIVPTLAKRMSELDITPAELVAYLNDYKSDNG